MIGFEWPWLLLAAPAPWAVRRFLPAARPAPPPALWIPFFGQVSRAAEGSGGVANGRAAGRLALAAWAALVVAAARPLWQAEEVSAWPLAAAAILAAVAALRTTRAPRPIRSLPYARQGEDRG